MKKVILSLALVLAVAGAAQADTLMPLTPAADELGFGTQIASLTSTFGNLTYSGTVDSRVYAVGSPATQATFVWDIQVTWALRPIENVAISAQTVGQKDLRIGEILGGVVGYVSGTTNIPNDANGVDNGFPTSDVVSFLWDVGNRPGTGARATLYVTTTGAVDIGEVTADFQDGAVATCLVLAPVDDPSNPDLNVPEPATLSLLGLGAAAMIRRRRA